MRWSFPQTPELPTSNCGSLNLVRDIDHPLLQGTIAPLSRRAPVAPAARRRAVLRQPHTGYSLYAGHDVVEVLTKCRVQHLLRGKDPFVAAACRPSGDLTMKNNQSRYHENNY
jgi:hypothetical protein